MAKGFLCIALTACLLASAQSQIALPDIGSLLSPVTNTLATVTNTVGSIVAPVTSVVSGLTNTLGGLSNTVTNLAGSVTNVAGGLVGTVTNVAGGLTGGLTGSLGGLTGLVTDLLNPLLNTITGTLTSTLSGLTKGLDIGGLTGTLGNVLQTAVGTPLNVVNQLTGSVTSILNPANLTGSVTGALKPVLDAVTSLTNQLTGTGAVGCILNSATTGLKTVVLTVTSEIINCGIPKTTELFKIASNVSSTAGKALNVTTELVGSTTKCLQQTASSANIGGTVGCVVDPVQNSVSVATNTLSQAAPLISGALGSALQIPGCAVSAVTKAVNETTVLLQSVLQCALGKGVNASLPNLISILPNFPAIASKAVAAIDRIVSAALGPKSPIKNLLETLNQVKNIAATLTANALNVVNTTIQSVQEIINLATTIVGGNLAAVACVSDAQKVLTDLAPVAISNVVNCTVNVTNDAVPLVAQAAALNIGLTTGLLNAGVNAVTKCVGFVLSLDNGAEKCFDAVIIEVEKFIKEQFDKINKVIDSAQSLIDTVQNCLDKVINQNIAVGQTIVTSQKQCLAVQGIILKTDDISSVLGSGKTAVDKAVSGFNGSLNIVASTSVNIQGSLDFIKSINKTVVENLIKGQILPSQNAVLQLELALKDNTNPAVKACIVATKDSLSKLETSAVASILNCVSPQKEKITTLADQAVADDLALKQKLANAGNKAEEECSTSVSKAIAEKCFLDIEVNLNVFVTQTVQRVQQTSYIAEQLVNESTKCVREGGASVGKSVDAELARFTSCLGAQGISVKFTRT